MNLVMTSTPLAGVGMGPGRDHANDIVSAHVLAMRHGVVELYARNSPGAASPFPPEDLLESGIGIYLRGLGLIAPDG